MNNYTEIRTYVPPTPPLVSEDMVANGSSQMATEATRFAAKRKALTPPLPAPILKDSALAAKWRR